MKREALENRSTNNLDFFTERFRLTTLPFFFSIYSVISDETNIYSVQWKRKMGRGRYQKIAEL